MLAASAYFPSSVSEIKQEYNRRLRKELRDGWLGTYFYYYYCENNEPNQVRPATNGGVN